MNSLMNDLMCSSLMTGHLRLTICVAPILENYRGVARSVFLSSSACTSAPFRPRLLTHEDVVIVVEGWEQQAVLTAFRLENAQPRDQRKDWAKAGIMVLR